MPVREHERQCSEWIPSPEYANVDRVILSIQSFIVLFTCKEYDRTLCRPKKLTLQRSKFLASLNICSRF